MNSTDWKAAISSEIFQTYIFQQIQKEANLKKVALGPEQELEAEISNLKDFDKFENKVNTSPRLKLAFQKLQNTFIYDPEYTAKVDPKFVDAVMLLDLSSKEE